MASPKQKCSVNTLSTPHNTTLENVEQIAATGWNGISLHTASVDTPYEDISEAMDDRGLECVTVMPEAVTILPSPVSDDVSSADERVQEICAEIPDIASLEPEAMMVGPGTSNDPDNPLTDVEALEDGLVTIVEKASDYGLDISFEMLAKRRGAPIATLPEMVDFLESVGLEDVGITIDVWHCWPNPHVHYHLRKYIDYIDHVHLCDVVWEEPDRFPQHYREFPGDGMRMAPDIMATLISAGYDGWWELEVFSDDGTLNTTFDLSLWEMPHEEFLEEARIAYDQSYNEADHVASQRAR